MDTSIVFSGTVLAAVAGGLTIGFLLRQPLIGTLRDICNKESGARFWAVFSQSVLVLVPLFIATLMMPPPSAADHDLLKVVAGSISGGLLCALICIGLALLPQESSTRATPPRSEATPAAADPRPSA